MISQWLAIALIVVMALQAMTILTLLHIAALIRPAVRSPVDAARETIDALQLVGMDEAQAKSLMRELITTSARDRGGWRP